jgi:L-alanine-DL-glutamate epimerase-like enolase superfamily enzyme
MKLTALTVYALRIPFVAAFRHSVCERTWCDSVVVRVQTDTGVEGFGEGVARDYVTGETVERVVEHLTGRLWPALAGRELPELSGEADLAALAAWIPEPAVPGVLADHASRAALELALVDARLRTQAVSAGAILRPRRATIAYSGVITAGPLARAVRLARHMTLIGFGAIKIKVGFEDDVARVRAIREAVGPRVSLRVDANGAWTLGQALEVLDGLASCGVVAVEQPLPRGGLDEWKRLKGLSPIPLMADESLVTRADAEGLFTEPVVDAVNIRVSKCGGLARSLELAALAARAGVRVQVGSDVGETAILSAAGRHLAAALPDLAFAEGSYGALLLTEDVSAESIRFGHRGEARVLTGPGLGVQVLEDRLRRFARRTVELSA